MQTFIRNVTGWIVSTWSAWQQPQLPFSLLFSMITYRELIWEVCPKISGKIFIFLISIQQSNAQGAVVSLAMNSTWSFFQPLRWSTVIKTDSHSGKSDAINLNFSLPRSEHSPWEALTNLFLYASCCVNKCVEILSFRKKHHHSLEQCTDSSLFQAVKHSDVLFPGLGNIYGRDYVLVSLLLYLFFSVPETLLETGRILTNDFLNCDIYMAWLNRQRAPPKERILFHREVTSKVCLMRSLKSC